MKVIIEKFDWSHLFVFNMEPENIEDCLQLLKVANSMVSPNSGDAFFRGNKLYGAVYVPFSKVAKNRIESGKKY
jgi:hypothetical protein